MLVIDVRHRKWLKGAAYTGRLPTGCVHCARGGKLVLLVTGKCHTGCYYCPLSIKKKGKGVVYADEMMIASDEDIVAEGESIGATGTGITGGDPLLDPAETSRLISLLKESFSGRHHVHLYTSSPDRKSIMKVVDAGLDEIRFHPPMGIWKDIDSSEFRVAVEELRDLGLEAGFEIPAIPGMHGETLSLLHSAGRMEASFVNINELEFSESNWRALRKRGFEVKDDISASVRGSQRMALRLLEESPDSLPTHYCSSSFKDAIQLRRRIMRRARRVRRPLDLLTKDGTFVIGIIEDMRPVELRRSLMKEFGIPRNLIEANEAMSRVEIASWILEEISMEIDREAFMIEEYPTADRLEVERWGAGLRRR